MAYNLRGGDNMKCSGKYGECPRDAEERFSLGIYAGKYCDKCWKQSGYRDEPASGFDPMDAGEVYEPDDY